MTDAVQPIVEGQVSDAEVISQEPALDATTENQEPQAQDDKSEPSEAEKEFRRMQRRLEKAQRNNYKLHAELEQIRQSQPRQEQTEQPQLSEEQIRAEAKRLVEVERLNARCDDIVAEGSKKFKDFGNAVKAIQEEAPLFDSKGAPTALLETVLDADKPAELLHYLGSNPDLAAELADLTPLRQARRIALIEREMAEAKKPSGAPKPLEPVKQVASTSVDPDKMSVDEWVKWRNQQVRRA